VPIVSLLMVLIVLAQTVSQLMVLIVSAQTA